SDSVRASHDGGQTWQVLGINLSRPALTLDGPSLRSGDMLIEVQASDGVHVSVARAQTHVSKHPPHAQIVQTAMSTTRSGQPLALTGIAYDTEDGALSGDAVRWFSDRGGELGSGTMLWLERGLTAGTHLITLRVTDSDGNTS